jgi:DNA-binding HxlR family transcriptional regulator
MGKVHSIKARALQSSDAVELLSNKWRVTMIHLLSSGPMRASELQRAVPQVSPKMLTQTLRGMERDGLVQRKVRQTLPAHVEYGLTAMGESIIPPLRTLCHWAQSNAKERDLARRSYDESRKPEEQTPKKGRA